MHQAKAVSRTLMIQILCCPETGSHPGGQTVYNYNSLIRQKQIRFPINLGDHLCQMLTVPGMNGTIMSGWQFGNNGIRSPVDKYTPSRLIPLRIEGKPGFTTTYAACDRNQQSASLLP